MDDFCNRCRVQVGDYDGQLEDILEQVKIENDEKPSKPGLNMNNLVETPGGEPIKRSDHKHRNND